MQDVIKNFPAQFSFAPEIKNSSALPATARPLVVCGMGGSHLSADIYMLLRPQSVRAIFSDYGLPEINLADSLVICSSYSGNTEEVLESYDKARTAGVAVAIMAAGGRLIEKASADGVPYIQFPDRGIQPRAALGYGVMALAAFAQDRELQLACGSLVFDMSSLERQGRELASALIGHTPLVYASARNGAIAQNWKIKVNENSKQPAFWNVVPELNHNEMTGFDLSERTKKLSTAFSVVLLTDDDDHSRIKKRFAATGRLYEQKGIAVHEFALTGSSRAQKIFNTLLVGDWFSVALGEHNGAEIEGVPMVEAFKTALA